MPTFVTMHADLNDFISPNIVGADGWEINFDLVISGMLNLTETPRPSLLTYRRTTGYTRSDGRMYNKRARRAAPFDIEDAGELGVRLLASDVNYGPTVITYDVSGSRWVNGVKVQLPQFNTGPLPATGEVLNLASLAPYPDQPAPGVDGAEPIDGGGAYQPDPTGNGTEPIDGGGA